MLFNQRPQAELQRRQKRTRIKCTVGSALATSPKKGADSTELQERMTNTPAIRSNPVFALRSFDAHVDTPVEVLHTVLLGPVKYVLQTLVKSITIEQKSTLRRRFNVLNADGFLRNISGRALVYHGFLVGRDFKDFVQVASSAFLGPITREDQDKLEALSWLVVIVYLRTISDITQYQLEVESTLNWLLLCVSQAPPHLLLKRKSHYLRHNHDSCRRFGPPIRTATETFEGFNGVVRRQLGRTNRHYSSHDCAWAFALQH
ncbi:hypothetical protein RI367_008606 [Sorochytrium milnesiophthora]